VRNLFLILLLANILLLAWNRWVLPLTPQSPVLPGAGLAIYPAPEAPSRAATGPGVRSVPEPPGPGTLGEVVDPACVQIGPLPAAEAAAELARSLGEQAIAARTVARDTQVWVGNWIQIGGFATQEDAAQARSMLVAGGLTDALLMQEGAEPIISLGVFREKERADRVVEIARRLGYRPISTNRYRPTVEYWLLARLPGGAISGGAALPLPRPGILRVESVQCPAEDAWDSREVISGAGDPDAEGAPTGTPAGISSTGPP
jgi:hypothetical protein